MGDSLNEWVNNINTGEKLKGNDGSVKDIKSKLINDLNSLYKQVLSGRMTLEEYNRYGNYVKSLIERNASSTEDLKMKYTTERTKTIIKAREGTSLIYQEHDNKTDLQQQANKLHVSLVVLDTYTEMLRKKSGESRFSKGSVETETIKNLESIKLRLSKHNETNSTALALKEDTNIIKNYLLKIESKDKLIGKGKLEVIFRNLNDNKVENIDFAITEALKFIRGTDYESVSNVIEKNIITSKTFSAEAKKIAETKKNLETKELNDLSKELIKSMKQYYDEMSMATNYQSQQAKFGIVKNVKILQTLKRNLRNIYADN